VTDPSGAQVLGRLLWALSFQRRPGTVVVLGEDHLTTTPFDGDRSPPCLLAATGLASLDKDNLLLLRKRLKHFGPPTTTVKLPTFSMPTELTERDWKLDYADDAEDQWKHEKMSRRGGFICYSAPKAVLRVQAVRVAQTASDLHHGMGYQYLASNGDGPDGEVQVFSDFRARVSAARLARIRVLPKASQSIASPEERSDVWVNTDEILKERTRERLGRTRRRAQSRLGASEP
jgi:hypothetical protein